MWDLVIPIIQRFYTEHDDIQTRLCRLYNIIGENYAAWLFKEPPHPDKFHFLIPDRESWEDNQDNVPINPSQNLPQSS